MIGEDFISLTARGNLLLICGRTDEARSVFERAYALAPDAQLPAATESIARCMKAQDGSIGHANAWILSLHPPRPQ
jgi:predicted RNA polymerase sigma factor